MCLVVCSVTCRLSRDVSEHPPQWPLCERSSLSWFFWHPTQFSPRDIASHSITVVKSCYGALVERLTERYCQWLVFYFVRAGQAILDYKSSPSAAVGLTGYMSFLTLFAFVFENGLPDSLVIISRMPARGVGLSDHLFWNTLSRDGGNHHNRCRVSWTDCQLN